MQPSSVSHLPPPVDDATTRPSSKNEPVPVQFSGKNGDDFTPTSSVPQGLKTEWWEVLIVVGAQVGNLWRFTHFYGGFDLLLLVPAWMLADFVSGMYHWFADSYRTNSPAVNAIFFDNFQLHHDYPRFITKRPVFNVSWEVSLPSFVFTLYLLLLLASTSTGSSAFWSSGLSLFSSFAFWISVTNQAHRWAHTAKKDLPMFIKFFQRCGILLSPEHHHFHHQRPQLRMYCITSGVCDRALEAVKFWDRLERLVFMVRTLVKNIVCFWCLFPSHFS